MRALRVGLTGGIGTGKSEALRAFGRAGAGTFCADEIVHALSRRGKPMHRAIVRALGGRFLDARGELDRPRLAEAVFSSPALRRRLEKATHPLVWKRMARDMKVSRRPVVVADVPLLFETRAQGRFDVTVLVSAPRPVALRRIRRRDGLSRGRALARMKAQMPVESKARLADVVIENTRGIAELRRNVKNCYDAFRLIADFRCRS
ncbi:MAG: dephospho-CoA kinase [Elusimicrobia bacterium]|nr:dephospho-CoA kinase [Elusimicrobiota bacterium]